MQAARLPVSSFALMLSGVGALVAWRLLRGLRRMLEEEIRLIAKQVAENSDARQTDSWRARCERLQQECQELRNLNELANRLVDSIQSPEWRDNTLNAAAKDLARSAAQATHACFVSGVQDGGGSALPLLAAPTPPPTPPRSTGQTSPGDDVPSDRPKSSPKRVRRASLPSLDGGAGRGFSMVVPRMKSWNLEGRHASPHARLHPPRCPPL